MAHHFPNKQEFRKEFFAILGPESGFYKVVLIYSLAISLLTLAVPISLQLLVDTIANIALLRAVLLIGLLLFALLFLSGVMYALRAYTMELFSRKLYARVSSEIAMTTMLAEPDYFSSNQKSDLINRYFDIISLKKGIPNILTNGFTLILQSIIGFILVSFYHLYFLVFSLGLITLLWLVWKIWGWRAIETSLRLSEAKYQTAAWLQSLAVSGNGYHSSHNPDFGLQRTDELVEEHIECQSHHFKNTFAQLLSMLFLYAAASSILLSMGGWLVIQGELTLGQLVAAELIMSAIFVGLPQMAGYLDSLYYVCAGVEELSRFRQVKTEQPDRDSDSGMPDDHSIIFNKVTIEQYNQAMEFTLEIPSQRIYRVTGNIMCLQRMTDLLRRNSSPNSGLITIGGQDISETRRHALRGNVRVINRVTVPPLTIRDYLNLYIRPSGKLSRQQALALMRLDEDITLYQDGMDTMLSRGGLPLSQPQTIKLKLASALISEPAILVLEDIVDVVDAETMTAFLETMRGLGTTLLYFTQREDLHGFDEVLSLQARDQSIVSINAGETR